MKCLICAATSAELKPTLLHFGFGEDQFNSHHAGKLQVDILFTGVGMIATTYHLTKALLQTKYDLAINAGIAGAFDRNLKAGEVVQTVSEQFPEMGAEDGDDFLSLIKLELQAPNEHPFVWGELVPADPSVELNLDILQVRGITVNTVHGNTKTILDVQNRFNPQVESMEGAAFFYVCMNQQVPCIQIRSISNYVERRNRESWNIPLAVNNLNQKLISLITEWV